MSFFAPLCASSVALAQVPTWITILAAGHYQCLFSLLSLFLLAAISYAIYAFWVYKEIYEKNITGGKRLSRAHVESPSSYQLSPPEWKSWKCNKERILAAFRMHPSPSFATFRNSTDVEEIDHDKAVHQNKKTSSKEQLPAAPHLDMDHVYVNYFQLLWLFTFVAPFTRILWRKNILWLKIRIFLARVGILKKKPIDIEALAGKLILEHSQVIHYISQTPKGSPRGKSNVACFSFPDFPYVNSNGKMDVANLFVVEVDLGTKRMIKCNMDGEELSASQAVILLFFNGVSAHHVKLHAFGNWGTNVDNDAKEVNPFLHRNSLVTVGYNLFGFTMFPSSFDDWKKQGLLSDEWDPMTFKQVCIHGLKENILSHSHVVDLVPHSEFVSFITKVRSIFHVEFAKYKHLFPGVNAEGLFVGTVLHSLEHSLAEWNLEDPLWLDVDDPRFGKMAEMGRLVIVGFVPEVPGFYFHRYFRGSGHPFYEAVYAKAAEINKKFADHMDSCICR